MSEQSFVATLLSVPINFPWKQLTEVRHATELKITNNRVDVVYYQHSHDAGIGSVIAVEAKLKDWRKAIRQAYRDKLFADRSYVALPSEFAASAISNLAEFRRADVGLIVLNGDKAEIHHNPTSKPRVSPYHSNLARKSLATLIQR